MLTTRERKRLKESIIEAMGSVSLSHSGGTPQGDFVKHIAKKVKKEFSPSIRSMKRARRYARRGRMLKTLGNPHGKVMLKRAHAIYAHRGGPLATSAVAAALPGEVVINSIAGKKLGEYGSRGSRKLIRMGKKIKFRKLLRR